MTVIEAQSQWRGGFWEELRSWSTFSLRDESIHLLLSSEGLGSRSQPILPRAITQLIGLISGLISGFPSD